MHKRRFGLCAVVFPAQHRQSRLAGPPSSRRVGLRRGTNLKGRAWGAAFLIGGGEGSGNARDLEASREKHADF
jgi:hypothetical protein